MAMYIYLVSRALSEAVSFYHLSTMSTYFKLCPSICFTVVLSGMLI